MKTLYIKLNKNIKLSINIALLLAGLLTASYIYILISVLANTASADELRVEIRENSAKVTELENIFLSKSRAIHKGIMADYGLVQGDSDKVFVQKDSNTRLSINR